jgi:hypothetical protein
MLNRKFRAWRVLVIGAVLLVPLASWLTTSEDPDARRSHGGPLTFRSKPEQTADESETASISRFVHANML